MSEEVSELENRLLVEVHQLTKLAKDLAEPDTTLFASTAFIQKWQYLARQLFLAGNMYGVKLLLEMLHRLLTKFPEWHWLQYQYGGRLAYVEGDASKARRYADQFRQLAEASPNYPILIQALLDEAELVVSLVSQGKTLTAHWQESVESLLSKALKLSYEHNLKLQQVQSLNRLGRFYLLQLRWEASLPYLEKALALLQDPAEWSSLSELELLELEVETAFSYHWLGVNSLSSRDWEAAENLLRMSLSLSYRARNVLGTLDALFRLGSLYQRLGQPDSALLCFEGSLAICEQLGHVPSLLKAYYYKSLTLHSQGRSQHALPLARRAVELGQEAEQVEWLARAFLNLGQIYQTLQIPHLALVCHLRVIELYQPEDLHPQWIELLIKAGDYLLGQPQLSEYWEQALDAYRRALALIEINQRLEHLAPVLGKMARAFTKLNGLNGLDDAARCYRLELKLAGDLDSTALAPEVAVALRVEALTGLQCCAALRMNQGQMATVAASQPEKDLDTVCS